MTHHAPLALPLIALLAACSGGSTAPAGATDDAIATGAPSGSERTPAGPAPSTDEAATTTAQPTPTHSPVPADAVSPPPTTPTETARARIPARFVGTWAPDARACTADYDYQPAFQRITIEPDRIGFFETAGDVQAVAEAGGSTRITVRERVGDSYPVYAIMISLADGGRALNFIRDGERKSYVKCPG